MTGSTPQALGRALADARAARKRLSAASLEAPTGTADAAAAQAALFEALGVEAQGWKVGIRPDGAMAAPMHPIHEGEDAVFPYRENIILEIEIGVRLGSDLPARGEGAPAYGHAEIEAAVETGFLGLEVVDSTLEEGNKAPFPLFLADLMGNGGYVVGPTLERDAALAPEGEIVLLLDGEEIFRGPAVHPNADPIAPILGYANGQFDRLGGLKAGQIVTTGALCIAPLPGPGLLEARMNGKVLKARFAA
ncbi:hydratase [Arsenicitalea aurantiaca]|uniref:Hydratase n=1 Tax=Arsenicitalea aurantiaca TaxID=1783274 RepID=A0A433XB93_9HYPH|nr:hydratase [Arsenicitalea aurantiaca]RUT31345.1 hydratase [Arsenicitalea aurantiaca]